MIRKVAKRSKKKNTKRRKVKTYSKKEANGVVTNLQQVVDFKFKTLGKIYKNFTEKREREKEKKEKLKEKNRENQNKEEQKQLKEEEKQLRKEEALRLKEINIIRIEQERKTKEEQEEREKIDPIYKAVSYTHLTLPTIYSV